jgi:lipopolysaccharide/colanic/teichoic acid biosynthesis glycosyltransferase
VKRVADVVALLLTAPLWVPLLLLLAFVVRVKLGTPVFFRQLRPGRHSRPFVLVKFRTMTSPYGPSGDVLSDAERLTPFGRWLRASSLDELPECWNVLKGDMSLVGPRPLLMEYLPLYDADQRRRHDVRPGITGWAQVHGRNAISWEDRFRLDLWYVEHRTFWLDIRILWRTVASVLRRRGISASGEATMPKFTGGHT